MRLQHSTWLEIEQYLNRSSGIVVPIGSTEQHGPSGLIGTDALCAEAIAQGLGEHHEVLIAPTLALGVAQFNLGFPGTISVRAATLMALVEDIVQSSARHGFSHIYFLNGHGGNIAPLRAVFQDLYQPFSLADQACPFRCRVRSWWEYPRTHALRQDWFGEKEGLHATPSEIAITQHVYPDSRKTATLVVSERLDPRFIRERGGDNHYDAREHRQRFPDGRVGSDPGLATAEQGRQLLETAITEAYEDYRGFLAE